MKNNNIFLNKTKKALFLSALSLTTISFKNTNCSSIFEEMDRQFELMDRNMTNMRNMFTDMQENIYKNNLNVFDFDGQSTKNSINVHENNGAAIIAIDLGKNVKNFDAKIQTKKDGFKQDQINIKTGDIRDKNLEQNKDQNNLDQDILIKVNGNYLSITQNSCSRIEQSECTKETEKLTKNASKNDDKKESKNKKSKSSKNKKNENKLTEETLATKDKIENKDETEIKTYAKSFCQSSISTGQTFVSNLDISKTIIEYDEKTGILTLTIPQEKTEENSGKIIDVKIKK